MKLHMLRPNRAYNLNPTNLRRQNMSTFKNNFPALLFFENGDQPPGALISLAPMDHVLTYVVMMELAMHISAGLATKKFESDMVFETPLLHYSTTVEAAKGKNRHQSSQFRRDVVSHIRYGRPLPSSTSNRLHPHSTI